MEAVTGIQDFVQYVVAGLTGQPEQANITRRQEGGRHVFDIRVAQADIGRILGHSGNTVMAVRNLAIAAAAHQGVEVGVEVLD